MLAKKLKNNLLPATSSIRDVAMRLNEGVLGIVFVVDADNSVKGIFTDGDLRRAFIAGAAMSSRATDHMNTSFSYAREEDSRATRVSMLSETIRHIPILDQNNRLVDFLSWNELLRVPLVEPHLAGNELKYVTDCITANWISSQGAYVTRFEEDFAGFVGSKYALTSTNGTAALHLALMALGIGPGDEVIVPDLTFAASASAVKHCGANPILVDIDPGTWGISPDAIGNAVTANTKAIMPVHLYGQPCDMEAVLKVAREHGLAVVEDSAEALGAKYKGRYVGTLGDVGCFSFFSNKVITTGEGGMVVTDDVRIASRIKKLRDHGMSSDRRYWHDVVGYNYRMTNLQAAVGVAQMERIEDFLRRRDEIAESYRRRLSEVAGITLPERFPWSRHINWLFSVLVDEDRFGMTRDSIIDNLAHAGVETRPFFYPLHEQPPFFQEGRFDTTNSVSYRGLCLPCSNNLRDEDIDRVCSLLSELAARQSTVMRGLG